MRGDPIRFEVIRSGLMAASEEMGAALQRSAYSTNIKTRADFSCALLDSGLRVVAQSYLQPTLLGALTHVVPRAIEEYGPERLRPGDGILINDPHLGSVHLNDVALISPIFNEDELVGKPNKIEASGGFNVRMTNLDDNNYLNRGRGFVQIKIDLRYAGMSSDPTEEQEVTVQSGVSVRDYHVEGINIFEESGEEDDGLISTP